MGARTVFILLLISLSFQLASAQDSSGETYLIIRTDDAGMSHSVNMGLQRLLEEGYPVTVSVMFPCPWYQEAVSILQQYGRDQVTVGIHLTLNSEWEHYRWGPVAGKLAVPSLVDKDGYFFHSAVDLYEQPPIRSEVETEVRAQIERAINSGLEIEYIDYHMGTAYRDSMMMSVTEELAREYGLALWGYFPSKRWDPQYRADPAHKGDSLVAAIGRMKPGYNHFVTHVGIDNAELGAMRDMNSGEPLAKMSRHRQGELDALTSEQFRQAVESGGITIVPFRKLIKEVGLENMYDPRSEGY